MKNNMYFLGTKFHEYHKQQKVCGIKVGKPIPTIELISIGIVSEGINTSINITNWKDKVKRVGNGEDIQKTYYAISKDFDIKAAWNSWQPKKHNLSMGTVKEYWLRENVLKPIFNELELKEIGLDKMPKWYKFRTYNSPLKFTYTNFKRLINKYGKSNKQIVEEIKEFIYKDEDCTKRIINKNGVTTTDYFGIINKPTFYAYYADYDWVVFCQLFGKMINLPKGFPKYCIDLKQELNKLSEHLNPKGSKLTPDQWIDMIKEHSKYPKQNNEHNALSNAKWNKELHIFIKNL